MWKACRAARPPTGCDAAGEAAGPPGTASGANRILGGQDVAIVDCGARTFPGRRRTTTCERAITGVLGEEAEREFVELPLLEDPRRGVVVAGTGGFRKLRVPLEGRGKRGGGRVVYYFASRRSRVYLVAFFAKNVSENLTPAERNALKTLARNLERDG